MKSPPDPGGAGTPYKPPPTPTLTLTPTTTTTTTTDSGLPKTSDDFPLYAPPTTPDGEQGQHHYPEGGPRAWLVVAGAFCALGAVFGLINTSAVFESRLGEHQLRAYSRSQVGWIFSLYLFLVFSVGILVGPVFDAQGPRLLVLAGSVLMVASLVLLSFSQEYYQVILSYSVVGGVGGALLYCPAYGAIAHFFNERRGLATGIATTAGGIGGIAFPLLLQALLGGSDEASDGVGFAWSCRILALILLVLCGAAILLIRGRPSSSSSSSSSCSASSRYNLSKRRRSVWPDLRILRHRGFASAAVGVFFTEWGLFVPLTYIISFARSHGRTEAESAVLLASLNAGSVLGRFLPGLLADHAGRFNVIIATLSLCVASTLGLWLPSSFSSSSSSSSPGLLYAFCVVFGFASGSNLGLIPVCIGQFCDCAEYGRYVTTANMVASFGTLTSVPIGGALLGAGGDAGWAALVVFTAVAYAMALACYVSARVSVTGWRFRVKF